jgi:hypothetical protein
MLTATQVGTAGEVYVTQWLQANGYACYRNTQLPGATDIEATAIQASLLVQVKTAIWPSLPADLAAEEKRAIVARATRSKRQAWLAQLQINNEGVLLGQISWTRLA